MPLATFTGRHGPNDIGISGVSDGHGADPEVLSARSAQFDVVSRVVVHARLGQHGVILDLRFPERYKKKIMLGKEQAINGQLRGEGSCLQHGAWLRLQLLGGVAAQWLEWEGLQT